ncbi:MAG: sensor histidine kinase [Alphaproteobacteria bacterium]
MRKLQFGRFGNFLKNLFPKDLFGRATLMVVLPMFFVQIIVAVLFWDNHWQRISNRLAKDLIGEVRYVLTEVNNTNDLNRIIELQQLSRKNFDFSFSLDPKGQFSNQNIVRGFASDALRNRLIETMPYEWQLSRDDDGRTYYLEVSSNKGLLTVTFDEGRIFSSSTFVVIIWGLIAALFFVAIAELFLRNQVRALRNLASVADAYGKGRDIIGYRPHGATEVRQVGASFLSMRRRLNRYIDQRTLMLSAISHDMRTPLTRIKLELDMLDTTDTEAVTAMQDDIAQMENMMREWLAFVRGEDGEQTTEFSLSSVLQNIIEQLSIKYGEGRATISDYKPIIIEGREGSLKRALTNIIENAIKYGSKAVVDYNIHDNFAEIIVDDYGKGIDEKDKELVFRPFYRVDSSRNEKTGGVGLGLAIARDIITAHGGDIYLETAPTGGLRARILLPL